MTRDERWDQDASKILFNLTSSFDLSLFIYVMCGYVFCNNGKIKSTRICCVSFDEPFKENKSIFVLASSQQFLPSGIFKLLGK